MRTETLNGHVIVFYDSIDELPIRNFQKYNKCLLVDSGIGSDIDSIGEHIVEIAKFINGGDKKKAITELTNLRSNLIMVSSEISPKNMTFASLIKSVDGEELTDLSDSSLSKVIEKINDVPQAKITELLDGTKKKITEELIMYFPSSFDSSVEKEAYSKLKRKAQLQIESIVKGTDNASEIREIDAYLLSLHKPQIFDGKESVEIQNDKHFASICVMLSQQAHLDAKNLSVLEFYQALEDLEEQAKAKQKALKH